MPKPFNVLVAGVLAGTVSVAVAASNLTVTFVEPGTYADAGYWRSFASDKDRAEVQHGIERHLQRLAERNLPGDAALHIEVLDIDLAGRVEPFALRNGSEVRIARDISWPRIKLRYTLTRGGETVAGGEEQLADMNYLRSINRYSGSDRLRYEKAMLDRWFERRIARP